MLTIFFCFQSHFLITLCHPKSIFSLKSPKWILSFEGIIVLSPWCTLTRTEQARMRLHLLAATHSPNVQLDRKLRVQRPLLLFHLWCASLTLAVSRITYFCHYCTSSPCTYLCGALISVALYCHFALSATDSGQNLSKDSFFIVVWY